MDKLFSIQDLVDFVVSWQYGISFDDALTFLVNFANQNNIELDANEVTTRWRELHQGDFQAWMSEDASTVNAA